MKASLLVYLIEHHGGRFIVRGRSVAAVDVPAKFQKALEQEAYLVTAFVLEREASRKWEASGHNPNWWRK